MFLQEGKLCLYTNKILFKGDYSKQSLIKPHVGKVRMAKEICKYIVDGKLDDRLDESNNYRVSIHVSLEPSSNENTTSPSTRQKSPHNSKNISLQRKTKKKKR